MTSTQMVTHNGTSLESAMQGKEWRYDLILLIWQNQSRYTISGWKFFVFQINWKQSKVLDGIELVITSIITKTISKEKWTIDFKRHFIHWLLCMNLLKTTINSSLLIVFHIHIQTYKMISQGLKRMQQVSTSSTEAH